VSAAVVHRIQICAAVMHGVQICAPRTDQTRPSVSKAKVIQ
jgi:hypothetical protein